MTPQRVAFTTHGETGSIECLGSVSGQGVTGPGTLGLEGFYDGSCVMGTGSGTLSMTIPTTSGDATWSFPFTFFYQGGIGFKSGGPLMGPLTFSAVPVEGDCVTTPATKILQVGQFVLGS